MSQAALLKQFVTKENVQNLMESIQIMDESSAIPMTKLDILYAIIKTGMTKPGGRQVRIGDIFVPDGEEDVLVNFLDEKNNPFLDGIVFSMFQEKAIDNDENDPKAVKLPMCSTVFIPPIMGRAGYRHGECNKCIYGKYVEGEKSACLPVIKFLILKVVNNELKIVQVKAHGVNQKPAKDQWVSFVSKVKGKTMSSIAIFSTEQRPFKTKEGKEYNIDFWTIAPGESVDFSIEQKELLKQLQKLIQDYHLSKFQLMKEVVASEADYLDAPAQQYTAPVGTTGHVAIPHQPATNSAPVNQVADLAIDAEIVAPAPAPATPVEEPKKVLRKAASDIQV